MHNREHGGQGTRTPTGAASRDRGGSFFILVGFFIEKSARSSRSCDGPSWAASNTAIESFWRCLFVEI